MIKIFFEHSIFLHQKNGGISKYFCRLFNDLEKNKEINIDVYSPITINENLTNLVKVKKYYFKFNKIPRFCTKLFYLINDLLNLTYIIWFKPNIIHFTYYNYFLSKIIQSPFVITVHDLIHEKLYDGEFKLKRQFILSKAKKIICISNHTKKDLIKYYKVKENKIETIYHGVKKNKNLKIEKKNFILYVGDRGRYKNFNILLNAYRNSKYLNSNYKLICFGGDTFSEKEISKFVKFGVEKNIIYKSGNDNLLSKYYRLSKVMVYTSKFEGFGIPLIEALSNKCPVLVNDIKVFREILENDGIYYKLNNTKSLQLKLEKFLKNQSSQEKKIMSGYQRAKNFSLNKSTHKHLNLYKNFKTYI